MRANGKSFVMVSGFQAGKSVEENYLTHAALGMELILLGYSLFPATGVWEGKQENAYLVVTEDLPLLPIISLAARFSQDCILHISKDAGTDLIDARSGTRTYVGQWREVTEVSAKESQAYTKVGRRYFRAS